MRSQIVPLTRDDDLSIACRIDGRDAPKPDAEATKMLRLPHGGTINAVVLMAVNAEPNTKSSRQFAKAFEAVRMVARRLVRYQDISPLCGEAHRVIWIDRSLVLEVHSATPAS